MTPEEREELIWTPHRPWNSWDSGQRKWVSTPLCSMHKPEHQSYTTSPSWAKECDLAYRKPPPPTKWAPKVEQLIHSSNWGPAKLRPSTTEATAARTLQRSESIVPTERLEKSFSPTLPGEKNDSRSSPCQSPHGLDSVHSQLAGPMHGSGRRVSCCKPLHFRVMTLLDSSAISGQGLTDCNLSKSAAVRRLAMQTKFEMIFGRVFQSEPSLAQKLTCFNEAGLTIKSAEGDKTTCTLKHGKRCIDWFRVSASSGADIDAIQIIRTDAFARPYSPVTVSLQKTQVARMKKLVVDAPAKIPRKLLIGPLKTPPNARRATTVAQKSPRLSDVGTAMLGTRPKRASTISGGTLSTNSCILLASTCREHVQLPCPTCHCRGHHLQ